MAIETVTRIMERIKQSPPSRPISVFVVKVNKKRCLDAIYGNTVESRRRETELKPIKPKDCCSSCGTVLRRHLANEWLGHFHNHMPVEDVRAFLKQSIGE